MTFNKSKSLESALKSLNQGKLAQAINEYQQILRHDPKDQVTLMTVGDLLVRQGDTTQATEYFERLAQLYLHNGFVSKAIAIYKKIAKLTPAETQPVERLAELYVQQGVLSEARPLFLQLAETHLKAEHPQRAVEVLRRLLEVEPENTRVQTRLAELYLAIGQKKEAAQTYLNFARRLFERQEFLETQKMADKALEADPGNKTAASALKAQALAAGGHTEQAIALLETLPDADAGGDTTTLLVHLALKAGKTSRAVDLARKSFARGAEHYPLAYKVVEALLEEGQADVAVGLLSDIREAMVEAGEHDRLGHALSSAAEALPGRLEPLEWLVDLYRRASDPFRLPDAISRLADASAAAGRFEHAETLLNELLERDPDNETLLRRLNEARQRLGRQPKTPTEIQIEKTPRPEEKPVAAGEPPLDEETQHYVTQALTDVDLFSSYGLMQKAIQLLENVLQRAPRHTPALERLLDFYLGTGDDRRTAELAAQLEQIHERRGDSASAERFGELHRRFQRAAGLAEEDIAATQRTEPAQPLRPAEFSVPAAEPEALMEEVLPAAAEPRAVAGVAFDATADAAAIQPAPAPLELLSSPLATHGHEIDLSDEWIALTQEITEATPAAATTTPSIPEAFPVAEVAATEDAAVEESADFELELVPSSTAAGKDETAGISADQFLSQLAAEVEGLVPLPPASAAATHEQAQPEQPQPARAADEDESLEQLRDVFQEFRAELGEMGGDDEDLETHYNLGIAYREMGLLDEAIGEFQKVAKAVSRGEPFRYAMQCSTLLGLSFMAKGEPKIATLWYGRALETPGLDQESVLALRYDLGISQELAGDADAALESFRQVYAMNIDYRDVAERIAALQKR